MIHGHGDDLYKSGKKVEANFSTNVWYGADCQLLAALLRQHAERMFHYPEPDAGSFRQAVAAWHGLSPEQVIAGNGATELFYLIAHAFAGASTVIPVPSFREYEDACTLYHHRIEFISGSIWQEMPECPQLMFICNPNNPDGKIWQEKEIRELLEHYPEMTLVVDESFLHFAPAIQSAAPLLAEYDNLLVVCSMTKNFAIPGLRLGYMLGSPEKTARISRFKQPWTVNALAVEMGKELLQRAGELLPDAQVLLQRQQAFAGEIAKIPGFTPCPSHTSFFLVRADADAGELKRYLLEKEGILIRDASNFRGLDRHYFRINTLTDEKNNLLTEALRKYVG